MEGYAKVSLTMEIVIKINQLAEKVRVGDKYLNSIDYYKTGFCLWGRYDKDAVKVISDFIESSPFFIEYRFLHEAISWAYSKYAWNIFELEKLSTGFSKEIYLDAELYQALNRVLGESK